MRRRPPRLVTRPFLAWPLLGLLALPAHAETSEPVPTTPAAAPPATQPAPSPAPQGPLQPYQLIRTLQALQNQAAMGSRAAHAGQRGLLRELEAPLSNADPALWADPRNTRAVVLYALSGGQPGVLDQLLKRGEPAGLPAGLAVGALAYLMGDNDKARTLLAPLDLTVLPDALGGQLALVQANLIARNDQKRALLLLDQARLLAPGSLVEEAALRRTIFISGEINDLDRLQKATSQYLRRFGNSIYADNFRQSFAAALVRFEVGREPGRFPQLLSTMQAFDENQQRAVFLIISRAALIRGNFEQAQRAAAEAAKLAKGDQETLARTTLYTAASRIAADRNETTLAKLKTIDTASLPAIDKPILETALRVASRIVHWPAATTLTPSGEPVAASLDPRLKPLVSAAERGLGEAEDLLKLQRNGDKPR